MAILRQYINYQWDLPAGYVIRSPDDNVDLKAWADLLSLDGGFGIWTPERVKSEILSNSITPDAASLVFYKKQLVGCGSAIDCSTAKHKIGMGMWLMLHPSHQGKRGLAHAITYRTLAYFAKENYEKVIGTTDPSRLPVLYLHLSNGVVPEYDSLYSFIQWWKIKKRLKPLLERAKRKKLRLNTGK